MIGLASGLLAGVVGGGSDALIVPLLVGSGLMTSFKMAVGTSSGYIITTCWHIRRLELL